MEDTTPDPAPRPKYVTLGDMAEECRIMKDQGMTRGAMQYVMDQVWWEEPETDRRIRRGLGIETSS